MNSSAVNIETKGRLDDLLVLFVEDAEDVRELLPRFLSRRGARVLCAHDGDAGLQLFKQHRPQIVISDIRMPNMDGIAMSREIRALDAEVPIIFLSAHNEVNLLHASIELGITRYLTKPADIDGLIELISSIHQEQEAKRHKQAGLKKMLFEAEYENERLSTYVTQYLEAAHPAELPNIRYLDLPKERVSGDVFCTASYGDTLYILVADGTGHGLSAVVPVLQVPRIFRAMAAKNYSLLSIADEINRELGKQRFSGHFLAATLIRVDPQDEFIEVLNFGNPAALLLGTDGRLLHEFASTAFALGLAQGDEFSAPVELYRCSQDANFYVFTDGLVDTLAHGYHDLDATGLRKLFLETPTEALFDKLSALIDGVPQSDRPDDITLVEISFRTAQTKPVPARGAVGQAQSLDVVADILVPADLLVIAEDEADVHRYQQCFGTRVSRLNVARSAEAGVASFVRHHPALVVVDLPLGTAGCQEAMETIRGMDSLIPLIFVSATCTGRCAEKLLDLGITKFLSKPLDNEKLIRTVAECFHRHTLASSAQFFSSVFASLPLATLIANADKEIVAVNPAFCQITGYTQEEVLGRNPSLLSSGMQDAGFYRTMWAAINAFGIWSGEIWNRRKNGDLYLERVSINTLNDAGGKVTHYVATFTEIVSGKR